MDFTASDQPVSTLKRGISGSTLKIIAIITMLIDHVGAVVIAPVMFQRSGINYMEDNLYGTYSLLRSIGRIGFPIFCFLLVEGFLHTRDMKRYAIRLGIFAFISEIPFNLAFFGKIFSPDYQNVFFTLLIGLLVMMAYKAIQEKLESKITKIILYLLSLSAGAGLAYFMKTDYKAFGVICIMVIYVFRYNKLHQIFAGAASFYFKSPAAIFAFIPISLYNGKRGISLKYIFYAFYPVHLLILYFIMRYILRI